MKYSIVLLAAGLIYLSPASAQKIKKSELPEPVSSAFKKSNPGIRTEKWGKENGNYEAEYKVGKVEHTTVLSPGGVLVQTETDIRPATLPAKVLDAVKKKVPGGKISEAAEIISPDGKKSFEAEIKGIDYIYDASGQLIKTAKD